MRPGLFFYRLAYRFGRPSWDSAGSRPELEGLSARTSVSVARLVHRFLPGCSVRELTGPASHRPDDLPV